MTLRFKIKPTLHHTKYYPSNSSTLLWMLYGVLKLYFSKGEKIQILRPKFLLYFSKAEKIQILRTKFLLYFSKGEKIQILRPKFLLLMLFILVIHLRYLSPMAHLSYASTNL